MLSSVYLPQVVAAGNVKHQMNIRTWFGLFEFYTAFLANFIENMFSWEPILFHLLPAKFISAELNNTEWLIRDQAISWALNWFCDCESPLLF